MDQFKLSYPRHTFMHGNDRPSRGMIVILRRRARRAIARSTQLEMADAFVPDDYDDESDPDAGMPDPLDYPSFEDVPDDLPDDDYGWYDE